ncbi:MAG: phosphodiesterase [Acetobacteraceae bacterium]
MLIAQLTDLHVRPIGMAANRVVETNMLSERAFRAVMARTPLPDVILLTGDLTETGSAAEYAVVAGMLARYVSVPVFAIPGNHDRRDTMLAAIHGTREHDGFIQYALEDFPVRLVMLDTLVPGEPLGSLCPRRLAWLDRTLAAVPDKPTLIAMHHPPFLCGIAHMDHMALQERAEFAAVIARHRQVERIISGHDHRSVTARVAHAIATMSPSVAHQVDLDLRPESSSAFMLEPPAYQLHSWSAAHGFVTHTALVENYPGPFPFMLHD